jgi:multiple antibiotic resistance protein
MNTFWLCFVPLFVAVDAIGVLPLFVSLTEGMDKARLRTVIFQSIATALIVVLVFLAFGPVLLRFLGITVPDFMIAGGVLLLAISLSDLLSGEKSQRQTDPEGLGAVPLGVPLIAGPAVLTTCILLAGLYGRLLTTVAVVLNIGIVGVVFLFAEPLTNILGRAGTRAISKIASLLLAAIAVMLIRRGFVGLLPLLQE